MSSGKAHGQVTVTAGVAVAVAVAFGYNPIAGLYFLLGSVVGLFVEPDLDIDGITASEKRVLRPLRIPWRVYWYPYALMVKHRSWISHMPVVSTFIRLFYLLFPICLILQSQGIGVVSIIATQEFAWVVAGLILSDALHWLFDVF